MKKLMIAAAVAAMIGGAQADMAYDFTATVKTTKAKQGSATTKTIKVAMNRDADPQWWYEDMNVFTVNADDSSYLDYDSYTKVVKLNKSTKVGTLQTSRLDNDGKASLANALLAYSNVIDPTTGETYGQPEYYKGKEKWCANWSYKVYGTCIRAKGSEKITAHYMITNCCTDLKFTQSASDILTLGDINLLTLYRFGGVIGEKCNNVELVGYIGDEGVGSAGYNTIPAFAIAGQGTWSTTQKNASKIVCPGIASISGNIVGIWYESECEVCCGYDASSLAYNCDLNQHNIGDGNDQTPGTYVDADGIVGDDSVMGLSFEYDGTTYNTWGTAAFGTFTLKFNSKNSL